MVRVLRDPNKKGVGAPRGTAAGVSAGVTLGSRVPKDKASKFSVRRLIARDPAKGVSANIGTKNDIGLFTINPAIPNTNDAPNPRILTAHTKVGYEAKGTKHVVNRGPNRNLKRLK